MKARVATILSLTGVLVAGSAAALVNTQVLRSTTADAGNSVAQMIDATTSVDPGASVTVVGTSSSATTTSAASDAVKVYEVQNTGRITLDTSNDTLRLSGAEPIAPWQLLSARQVDALTVEVKFVNGDGVVTFLGNLLFDEITTDVQLSSLATGITEATVPTSTGGSGTTRTTVDDDDDDDSHTSTGGSQTTVDDRGGHGGDDDSGKSDDD